MALPPKFAGHKLIVSSRTAHPHTLELYLDYVCPFSAKLFRTFYEDVAAALINRKVPYADKVQVIFRQQVQPWHPSSTLVHEAALAVLRLSPGRFWDFSHELFKRQTEYFDVAVVSETRNQTYARLAAMAEQSGISRDSVYKLLEISDKPGPNGELNAGNKVTDDLKQVIKANRVVGVHVTPTVFFNGIEEKSISSSFTAEQWIEWLEKNVV